MKILQFSLVIISYIMIQITAFGANLDISGITSSQYFNGMSLQNLCIDMNVEGNWKLFITPMSEVISNSSAPSKTIPINRLSIDNMNENKQLAFQPNQQLLFAQGFDTGHIAMNSVLKAIALESDYPGDYIGDLRFTLVTDTGEIERIFSFNFNQPIIQEFYSNESSLNIRLKGDDALCKNHSVSLNHPTTIYIKSNKEWKVQLYPSSGNEKLSYSFKIMTLPNEAQSSFLNQYYELTDTPITLAAGNPTTDSCNNLKTELLRINYMITTPVDDLIEDGLVQRPVEYILEDI